MDIRIEKLQPQHIDGMVKIENTCFSEPWSRNALEQLLTTDYAVYFAAVDGNETVGYSGMYVSYDVGAVNNIGVIPTYRRSGIGAMLVDALVNYARNNNITLLTLEVRSSNAPAISLYEKFGFKKAGIRKNYYKKPTEDALLYNLELQADTSE